MLERARQLRRETTDAEILLWGLLRDRQLFGAKFRRQHPIGSYVVDFYCREAKLIIELDGGQHDEDRHAARDASRSEYLQRQGCEILRFLNHEVRENLDGVLAVIAEHASHHPSPLPKGEGASPYHTMLDALPETVLWVDAQGLVQCANAAAEPLFLQSGAKLIGRPLAQWVQETETLAQMLAGGPTGKQALTLLPRHRAPLPVWIDVWRSTDAHGNRAPECVVRLHPVTAPQATSPQESASYMAAVLAHEIKNPLSGIRGAAQFLLPQLDDTAAPMARLIITEVDRIRGLLEQMDVFTQPKPAALEVLNIHESLRHAAALLSAGAADRFELIERFDPSLPPVSARRDALVQIVLNLMKNALEAMEGQPVPLLVLHTDYHRDGTGTAWVRLRVTDQGGGIPETLQPSIFEPFVTTKPQGKGLGLAIVAKLALDMGARLQLAESGPEGSVFELLLPLAR